MNKIEIKTNSKNELIDITSEVEKIVKSSKIVSGVCVVYCPHTTAGITVNENSDSDVKTDLLSALEKIVPNIKFKHFEGNSDAHLKSLITGNEKTFIVENGSLLLGQWQAIYFSEFDGPRNRTIFVKLLN